MKQGKKILTDAHGDEVLHLHRDILDADLTAAEKIMMAALRKQAFTTGRITLHYPDIAVLAHMPLNCPVGSQRSEKSIRKLYGPYLFPARKPPKRVRPDRIQDLRHRFPVRGDRLPGPRTRVSARLR